MNGERFTAYAEQNWVRNGVDIGLRQGDVVYNFSLVSLERVENGEVGPPPLTIPLDAARALYEALGEMLGYSTVNAQATRQDLLHERKRVDKMIDYLIQE